MYTDSDLAIKTTQTKVFCCIIRDEKHWTKVRNSVIAYSPSVSSCIQKCDHTPFTGNENHIE